MPSNLLVWPRPVSIPVSKDVQNQNACLDDAPTDQTTGHREWLVGACRGQMVRRLANGPHSVTRRLLDRPKFREWTDM